MKEISDRSLGMRMQGKNGNKPDSKCRRNMAVIRQDLVSGVVSCARANGNTHLVPKILFVFDEFRIRQNRQLALLAVS